MRFLYTVLLSACALMLASPLLAQSPNGVINGLVRDPSNKVIGGADILVINDATGVQYSGRTNDDGIYVVPNLPPGAYRLQVSKVGFKTLIKPDIILNIQDALSINFTLPVGAVFNSVTVEGGASMINTTDASVSTVVDQTYVKNMPLNGRSFQDLILLTPGVVMQTPQINTGAAGLGRTGEFNVNGQRTESNYYTVDGVSANVGAAAGVNIVLGAGASGSLAASTALGTTQALVSVDDLQEFRVQSSTYSAEYGRNPGGQFAFETKSGTNQRHGTAYDYLRNGAFDAPDWFNDYFGTSEPTLRQNDFGGTFGGPVEIPVVYHGHDKTFFFVSYEGLRLAAPQAASVNYVPDSALRRAVPSEFQPILSAFPVANGPDVGNGLAEFIASWSTPSAIDSTNARLDHIVRNNLRFFFRFSNTHSSSTLRGDSAAFDSPTVRTVSAFTLRTYTAGVTSAFSNKLNNEFRLNYSSNQATSQDIIDVFGGSIPVDLTPLTGLDATAIALDYGGYRIVLGQSPADLGTQRQWNLTDASSLSLGRHQLKFGLDFRRLAPFFVPVANSVEYLYLSHASVAANAPLALTVAEAPAYPLYLNFSAFTQDEWKVSSRLSLSFGLRWDINPAPSVTKGLKPYTLVGVDPNTWRLAPQGTPLWRTTWFNFGPRLGAAYVIHNTPGWETVIRGGGGVFFDTGQQLGSLGFASVGFVEVSGLQFTPFPSHPAVPVIINPPIAPYKNITYGFSSHQQLPYTLQWNASIGQAVGKSQAITASYVGSHAARLLQENLFSPANNPNIPLGSFLIENGLTSDYNSLQLHFRRRLNLGLTVLASYTWSHCIDYGSQLFLYQDQRGNCDFDVRHNLSTAFSYDLPNVRHSGPINSVLHHWGLDDRFTARTGFPVSLVGNTLLLPNGQQYYAGLNLVPGQPLYLYGTNCATLLNAIGDLQPGQGCPGGRAINPNAFTAVNSGLGDAPRNFTRGFGAWQMDMAVRRDFPIHEGLKLQFRVEAFNIFNHPNFGTINANYGESTFGQPIATLAESPSILNSLYQMGGPRSMQLALKIAF